MFWSHPVGNDVGLGRQGGIGGVDLEGHASHVVVDDLIPLRERALALLEDYGHGCDVCDQRQGGEGGGALAGARIPWV